MRTIFIGPMGGGKTAINGASVKNQFIIEKLKRLLADLSTFDTEAWRRRPWIIPRLLSILLTNRKARYVISISDNSAYTLLRLIRAVCPEAEIYYWVIGGSLGRYLTEGRYSAEPYRHAKRIIVEGKSMQTDLERLGLDNVITLSNFKTIPNVRPDTAESNRLRFIFLSRIVPYKGTDDIIEAVEMLNSEGLSDKFEVDFYGPVETSYTDDFKTKVNNTPNISYRGFINLRDSSNYTELTGYDVMLFPTYWRSEGCPGVIIDAYIAGLPIIASRWNLNEDYVDAGHTGVLVAPKDPGAIASAMRSVITGDTDLPRLKRNARAKAWEYDVDRVLSEANLRAIGIL